MGVSAFFMDHHLYTSDMSILYKALTRWTMESVKTTTVPTVSCSCCVLLWAIRRCAYDIGRSPARRPILRPTSPSPLAERASAPIYRSSPLSRSRSSPLSRNQSSPLRIHSSAATTPSALSCARPSAVCALPTTSPSRRIPPPGVLLLLPSGLGRLGFSRRIPSCSRTSLSLG